MLDPVTAEFYNAAGTSDFTINRTGAGDLHWGGKNVLDANGGSTVSFAAAGRTVFLYDFSLSATPDMENVKYRTGSALDAYARAGTDNTNDLFVDIQAGQNLAFSAARDRNAALFDFSGATNANADGIFTTAAAAVSVATERQILNVHGEYLFASGAGTNDVAAAQTNLTAADSTVTGFRADGNDLYVAARYDSPYHAAAVAALGLDAAAVLQRYIQDRRFVDTDEQFALIAGNFANAAPGHIVNMARVGIQNVFSVANVAIREALVSPFETLHDFQASAASSDAYADIAARAPRGPRFWAGYVGDLRRYDKKDGRYGYRTTLHGGLAGFNYDFGAAASVGLYGGYSRVKSDNGHVGLLARLAPFRKLPGLNVTVDGGFTFTDNSARRRLGTETLSGSFDQDIYTLSAGVFHRFALGNGLVLTPGASYRYTHLKQDGLRESVGTTSAAIDSMKARSHLTRVGLEVAKEYAFARGTLTPALSANWLHEFGDRTYDARAEYITPIANTFPSYVLRSNVVARNTMELGLSLRARRELSSGRSVGMNAGYTLGLADHATAHSVFANVEIGF